VRGKSEKGRGVCGSCAGATKEGEAPGSEREGAGRGAHGCGFMRERRLEERDEADRWAPLVSHQRERRGKGLAGWAKTEGGGGRRGFVFFSTHFKKIFNFDF